MFIGKILKSGNYIVPVPVSLAITLEYDDNGYLKYVYHGYKNDRKDVTSQLHNLLVYNNIVPISVGVKNGHTYVEGCLYTKKSITGTGDVTPIYAEYILSDIVNNPTDYTFYAGNVSSTIVVFRGAMPIRQWLTFNKFNLLPGYLITTTNNTLNGFRTMVMRDSPFIYPMFMAAMVFGHGDAEIENYKLTGAFVKSIKLLPEQSGQLIGHISLEGGHKVVIEWHDVVRLNIYEKSWVVLDREEIIYASNDAKVEKRTYTIDCPVCGKHLKVPTLGLFMCDDTQCNSRLYPRVCQLLDVLKLPGMTYERYLKVTHKIGDIFDVLTVLDLPEYNSTPIVASLAQVLSAIIPYSILPNANLVQILCNHCNNSLEVLDYYLAHPDRFIKDFGLDPAIYSIFTNWISESRNYMDVHNILHNEHIQITDEIKKFDGAPIFRNKTIMITGDFLHGSISEVQNILASYQANVITQFDENANCLIIGGLHDHIDGTMIANATKHNIVIFEETSFFAKYGIDDDIKVNL